MSNATPEQRADDLCSTERHETELWLGGELLSESEDGNDSFESSACAIRAVLAREIAAAEARGMERAAEVATSRAAEQLALSKRCGLDANKPTAIRLCYASDQLSTVAAEIRAALPVSP